MHEDETRPIPREAQLRSRAGHLIRIFPDLSTPGQFSAWCREFKKLPIGLQNFVWKRVKAINSREKLEYLKNWWRCPDAQR